MLPVNSTLSMSLMLLLLPSLQLVLFSTECNGLHVNWHLGRRMKDLIYSADKLSMVLSPISQPSSSSSSSSSSPPSPQYNTSISLLATVLSAAAYAPNASSCWLNSATPPRMYGQLDNVTQVSVHCDAIGNECSGFVARLPAENLTIISFRGTKNLEQLLNEAKELKVKPQGQSPIGGKVQKYFSSAQAALWQRLQRPVQQLHAAHPADTILVTGHSLGAAMATITAGLLAAARVTPLLLYTFGEPRVGNSAFAAAINAAMHNRAWRVVHYRDPVVHIPPCNTKLFCQPDKQPAAAKHHGTEIFYPSSSMRPDSVDYRECRGQPLDEDVSCSDSPLVWLPCATDLRKCIDQHRIYFGIFFGRWWMDSACRWPY